MGAFEYIALDDRGRQKKGVLEGDTPKSIRAQLRDRGLIPLEVSEAAQREKRTGGGISFRRGISATDLALLTRQLATLVRSGLPLEEALQAVAQQAERDRLANMMLAVRAKVMEGHTLANGFAEFPHVFPEIFRATVAAGEQSGHLDAVLERLADYAESRQLIQQKMMLALLYPIFLTGMSVVILTLLLAYVVPKIITVFEGVGGELPWITSAVINSSNFLRDNWGVLLLLIGLIAIIINRVLQKPGPRRAYHALLLRLPLIGRITRGFNTARFSRTLAILASSGVPVLESMRIAAEVVTNIPMRDAVQEAALRVREGTPINRALADTKQFPPMLVHLIASGETSGQLDTMLERAAQNQEREMETLVGTLLGIMEPVLILTMGMIVLIIVLAILLPIFNLNDLVR